jgi:type VI protein secretion system component Hcp
MAKRTARTRKSGKAVRSLTPRAGAKVKGGDEKKTKGRPTFSEIVFTKPQDVSSPNL